MKNVKNHIIGFISNNTEEVLIWTITILAFGGGFIFGNLSALDKMTIIKVK